MRVLYREWFRGFEGRFGLCCRRRSLIALACEVVESPGSAALSADQAVRFPINSARDGEPGFCNQRWLREQQRQKNRLVLRPEAGHPNLRMHLDWGCLGCWKNYRTKRPPASQPLL